MSSGLNFHLQVESFFPGGSEVEVPFADLQFHHFALTLDRDQGLSIGFDGNDPKTIITNAADKIKGDLLIEQLTIGHAKDHSGKEHRGFNGTIAGLHLWKKNSPQLKFALLEIGMAPIVQPQTSDLTMEFVPTLEISQRCSRGTPWLLKL